MKVDLTHFVNGGIGTHELKTGVAYDVLLNQEYREWLAARIRPLIRAHRLERGREDSVTGGVRSSALGRGTRPTTVGERAARAAASELEHVDLGAAAPAMLF